MYKEGKKIPEDMRLTTFFLKQIHIAAIVQHVGVLSDVCIKTV